MDPDTPSSVHAHQASGDDNTETHAAPPTPRTPKTIGSYHVKRVLATGGMGTVYEAVQEQPRRTVAVKVMKHGITSRSAMRRFEYESQLLARLRHPGIAQIYEAGTYDDGAGAVPFFAMEYIRNAKTITQYAIDKNLDTRTRLELFTRVCAAAHHGHQKGIIHRDLKPGNVLVDSHGDVKIIDFGVARGTDSDLAVTTLQTDVGQLLGTLQYMSPEQCEADPDDIDTRSDVYSLGVVLYELLSGQLPYNVTRAKIYESTRVIREEQPTSLATTNINLRGDIETIVLKALAKDRDRRYQSAAEMGADIQRYLDGEAITARPPSLAYQLRVFARRNKTLAIAATVVFLALAIGLTAVTAAYVRVQRARAAADHEQRLRMSAERQIERERAEADAFRPLSDRVGRPAPAFDTITLDGATVCTESFRQHPATVLNFVAANCPFSTRKIKELEATRQKFGRAGVRFVNIAQTMNGKRYTAAESTTMFSGEGADWELVYDPGNAVGKQFMVRGYPKLVVVNREGTITAAGTLRDDAIATALAGTVDANAQAPSPELEPNGLAGDQANDLDPAALEDLYRRRLDIQRRVLGKEGTAEGLNELADLYLAQGKANEAEELYRESITYYRAAAGNNHSLTRSVVNNLVNLLHSQDRFEEARRVSTNDGDDS